MESSQNAQEWLSFLANNFIDGSLVSIGKESEISQSPLDCSGLLRVIQGSYKTEIIAEHQQQQTQAQTQSFVQDDIEGNQELARRQRKLVDEQREPRLEEKDTSLIKPTYQLVDTELNKTLNSIGIYNISDVALEKALQHKAYFKDGIELNNLPAGFFLVDEKDSGKILKFDQSAYDKYVSRYPINSYDHPYVLRKADEQACRYAR
jgi:hypothetical protein